MDNRLNEMSKKVEERNTTLTNQINDFQKNQTQQSQRGSCSQNRGQNSNSFRGNNRGNFKGRFRGNNRGFSGRRPIYQRPQWQNQSKFIYATTTIISKLSAAKFKFLFSAAIFKFPTTESKLSKSQF